MDELRLILLIIGLIIIIGIYGTGRRQEKRFKVEPDNGSELGSINVPYAKEIKESKEPLETLSDNTHTEHQLPENQIETPLTPEPLTPNKQEKHPRSRAYNSDIERKIEPVGIENWHFRPIDSGLQSPNDSTAQVEKVEQELTQTAVDDTHVVSVKDPQEHQRFAHLEDSLLIVINVLGNYGTNFKGVQLQEAFQNIGLEYGDMRIYHYYPDDSQQRLFSVASIKEPGCFDFDNPAIYSTKGISLFMLLPGPLDGKLAFEILYGVATELANRLGGYLCDEDFNKLTKQATAHMKDKISDFNLHHYTQ